MKIKDLLEENRTLLSFEFFPPKELEGESVLDETVSKLRKFNPDFVSVTYGAGGSTREKTIDWTLRIKNEYQLNVMMHLTCIASSRGDINDIVHKLKEEDILNILALRGDPPKDFPEDRIKKDFTNAYQLVEYIRDLNGFSVGVAGHPEGHMEAPSIHRDMEFLKMKVDAGADFIITQLFFDNDYLYDFMDRAAAAGIETPIIPGIMPIVNIGQIQKFTQMCGATIPGRIVKKMEDRNVEGMMDVGVQCAVEQCLELLSFGVKGLHFYTLNRNQATERILAEIEGKIRI
ncbi:methylenetetrahydrofolate reductase [NAD(P)H] [bacterium]|nr:MAG: methylenetetrahydrofolate reductase [NAD(P)H] [bacterium]